MKSFDELFNEFFANRKQTSSPFHDELKKIIDMFSNPKTIENLGTSIDDELGEPTSVEEFTKDGLLFKRLIWETPHGKFMKVVVSDVLPEEPEKPVRQKSLQEQLDDALEIEDYELAIHLRDEIKKNKKS